MSSFKETLQRLSELPAPSLIKQREGWTDYSGKKHFVDYIEWHTAADMMDDICPNWSYRIVSINEFNGIIYVIASITIDGITREGIGTSNNITETGIKKAEHDALKRAAVKFGVARKLYRHDDEVAENDRPQSTQFNRQAKPPQKVQLTSTSHAAAGITDKQISMIQNAGQRSDVNVDDICMQKFKLPIEQLSKKQASDLITYLLSM